MGLFRGQCIQLDDTTDKLINHPSMFVAENTTVAVINQSLNLEKIVEKVRANSQLRVIYLSNAESDGQRTTDTEEENIVTEILKKLPTGSCVIPSSETRRLSLIRHLLFSFPSEEVRFTADLMLGNQGPRQEVDFER